MERIPAAAVTLFFDPETFIYDLETEEKISPDEFISGRYAVDEDSLSAEDIANAVRDYQAYIHTDGDRINNIYLKKTLDPLASQRVTTARVESSFIGDGTGRLTLDLKDVKDWSTRLGNWNLKYANMNLRIGQALVVKDGKGISPDQIKKGDRLFIVRDDLEAKIILVR